MTFLNFIFIYLYLYVKNQFYILLNFFNLVLVKFFLKTYYPIKLYKIKFTTIITYATITSIPPEPNDIVSSNPFGI